MSMGFNVCLAGATGWIGRPLSFAIASAGGMNFVGAVSRKHRCHRGHPNSHQRMMSFEGTGDPTSAGATKQMVYLRKKEEACFD
jgi:hypothetical protein